MSIDWSNLTSSLGRQIFGVGSGLVDGNTCMLRAAAATASRHDVWACATKMQRPCHLPARQGSVAGAHGPAGELDPVGG